MVSGGRAATSTSASSESVGWVLCLALSGAPGAFIWVLGFMSAVNTAYYRQLLPSRWLVDAPDRLILQGSLDSGSPRAISSTALLPSK